MTIVTIYCLMIIVFVAQSVERSAYMGSTTGSIPAGSIFLEVFLYRLKNRTNAKKATVSVLYWYVNFCDHFLKGFCDKCSKKHCFEETFGYILKQKEGHINLEDVANVILRFETKN